MSEDTPANETPAAVMQSQPALATTPRPPVMPTATLTASERPEGEYRGADVPERR